jgi:predicted nucleotide-binding protein
MPSGGHPDVTRKVFVVHGRNLAARTAMFTFLRAIGLAPIEWSEAIKLTGEASPYIGHILEAAFNAAQAIVVLLTPDDTAYLRSAYAGGSELAERLRAAGCSVDLEGTDWLSAGDFALPSESGNG